MQHTEFIGNILYYISVFTVPKIMKDINCQFCKQCLLVKLDRKRPNDIYYLEYDEVNDPAAFTFFINNGGLTIPCVSTFRTLKCAEKVLYSNFLSVKKINDNEYRGILLVRAQDE